MDLMVRIGNPRSSREGLLPAIQGSLTARDGHIAFSRGMPFKRETSYELLFALFEELVNAATSAERSRPSPVA